MRRITSPLDGIRSPFGRRFGSTFSPAILFAASEPGVWYDPSDLTTLFQDAAGTTPVTAVEQPVGLVLDKSRGLVLGAELVTNGDFSSATGWTQGAGWSISGGVATATATNGYLYQAVASVAAGKYYDCTVTITSYTSGTLRFFAGAAAALSTGMTASGTYTLRVCANSASQLGVVGTAFTGVIDNISIKEVSGSHASQATSASRPVLSARYNLLTYTEQFDNAIWNKAALNTTGTPSWVNVATAPDGTLTAEKMIENTASAQHYISRTATVVSGETHTLSVHLKAGERTWAFIEFYGGIPAGTIYINLSTGAKGTTTGSASAVTVTDSGNGWWRVALPSFVASSTSAAFAVYTSTGNAVNSYLGDGTSGIYIWGADLRVSNDGVGLPAYQRVGAAVTATTNPAVTGVPDYDTTGFPIYLRADGVDDRLIGPAISNIISASAYEACIGARVLAASTSSASPWLNHSLLADGSGYLGVGYVTTSNVIGAFNFDGSTDTVTQAMTPPSTFVLQQRHASGNLVLSLNGGSEASATSGDTSVFTAETRIFSSNGSTSVQARLYGMVVRSTAFTATERANLLSWMNGKVKAYA